MKDTFKGNFMLILQGIAGLVKCFWMMIKTHPMQSAIVLLIITNVLAIVLFVQSRVNCSYMEYRNFQLEKKIDSIKNHGITPYHTYVKVKYNDLYK